MCGLVQTQTLGGQQPDRQRQRLIVGEHHRRQLEARDQFIGSIAPAARHDGNAKVLQHGDITPERAHVYFHPLRQLRTRHTAMRLQ